jgi:hypothetical protein
MTMKKKEKRKDLELQRITRRFNRMLVESIIEGLDFGEVVLRFLELNYSLDRNQIAEQPEHFARDLEETLGPWMATIFERNIIRILCRKINVEYMRIEELSFSEAVKELLKKFLNASVPSA